MLESIMKFFTKQTRKQVIQPQLFVQYTKRDPQTHKIDEKIQKYTYTLNIQQKDWRRLKYKSYDVNKLLSNISGQSFIDNQFPHSNSSISQEDSQIVFEWKRIPQIIKFSIYSSAQTYQNFQRIAISNKKLRQALLFMYRTHPSKFKELLAHDINSNGLYQFKMYNKGVIQNVIIDDYIPVVNKNLPLMTGPIADRQIFPMLIQKAIAKICGGYYKIPQSLDELLQILFCGPLRKTKINELSNNQIVSNTIQKTLQNNGVAGFISRDNPKIRSFGISQNQLYHILNKYVVNIINQSPISLYQLVSEKKLVAWNGKFSHNDNSWQKVPNYQRTQLFKQLSKNKSFFISSNDIPRIFDHLIAFDGTDILNKQWIQQQSEVLYPSFSVFQLQKRNQVFIRVTTNQPLRTSLILAKEIGQNKYKFIKGAFHQNTSTLQITQELTPGKYVICVHHDWILNKTGIYSVFLSTDTHTILSIGKQSAYPNFLENLFKLFSQQSKKIKPVPDYLTFKNYYTIGMIAKQTGFAFIDFSLKQSNKKQVFIQIDPKALLNQAWEIIQPNTGRKAIHLEKGVNEQVMLILKTHKYLSQQNIHFPSTAFSVKA